MSGPVQPPLTVETIDGATVGRPITKIKVSNGTLAVSGSTATITISGGGGSGTVTSVGLTETGTALTITGSPVTTSGTINIAGAGTSSQVILGDLSLGTLTSGTVTGTGSANQVSYWTAASVQAGSTGLTYDPSTGNLTVGGYVEVGTKITTPTGTDLTLDTVNGTNSGSIVIADGVDGQVSISANGAGAIKLGAANNPVTVSNVYTLPTAVTTDNNYVLTAQTDGTTAWAASGGGSITFPIEADSGSASAPSYSFSADTDTGIFLSGASNMGIVAAGNSYLSIGSLGAVQFDRKALFNAATAAAPNGFATDTNTGFFQPSADTIGFSTAGTERLRFGSSGEILVGGTAAGTSGQVLTSGGSGAAVTWGNGGNEFNLELPGTDTNSGNNDLYLVSRMPGWGSNSSSSGTLNNDENPYFWPWISPLTGSITCCIDVTFDGSGTLAIAIYTDENGVPKTKIGGDASYAFGSTGTGLKELTFSSAVSVTRGTQYWIGMVESSLGNGAIRSENSTESYSASPRFNGASDLSSVTSTGVSLSNSDNTLPSSITPSDLESNSRGQPRWGIRV